MIAHMRERNDRRSMADAIQSEVFDKSKDSPSSPEGKAPAPSPYQGLSLLYKE